MNSLGVAFLLINVAMMLLLPRRLTPLPLLAGACLMTLGQGIEVEVFHFTVIRILIAAGLARVIIRGERLVGGINGLDWLMLAWSVWGLVSSIFHKDPSAALVYRLGLVYNACGVYFLFRIFCQSIEDIKVLCFIIAALLLPVAVEMLYEQIASHNIFSVLGGVSAYPEIRGGRIRANGPFLHPILAGTVGAVCMPLMIGIWQQNRKIAFIGVVSCLVIIIACASSGPLMSAMAGIAALFMWRYRQYMRLVRWFGVMVYIALDIVMKDPAYFIIARIDLVSGSTGWHRAALIRAAGTHLHEWWLAGTDFTRHWMPTGVTWSLDHTDITNYYLHLGVIAGFPWMFLFMAALAKGFSFVGQILEQSTDLSAKYRFMLWTLGSALFAHAVTSVSVSYFDQTFLFIYLTLAAISSAYSCTITAPLDAEDPERTPGLIPG